MEVFSVKKIFQSSFEIDTTNTASLVSVKEEVIIR